MYILVFKATVDVYPSVMTVEARTLQEAWDKANGLYSRSIDKIIPKEGLTQSVKVIPFGSTVSYSPREGSPITYPTPKKK